MGRKLLSGGLLGQGRLSRAPKGWTGSHRDIQGGTFHSLGNGPSDQGSAGAWEASREARGPSRGLLTPVAGAAHPAAATAPRCGGFLPWDPALQWPEAVSPDDGGVLGALGGWDQGCLQASRTSGIQSRKLGVGRRSCVFAGGPLGL